MPIGVPGRQPDFKSYITQSKTTSERETRGYLANETTEVLGSSRNPVLPLELDEPKDHGQLQGNTTEGSCIALLPQLSSDQSIEESKPFPLVLQKLQAKVHPPVQEQHARLWCDVLEADLLQDLPPDLPRKGAAEKKVITSFIFLVAELASRVDLQPVPKPSFRGPKPAQKCQPEEELHLGWGPGLHFHSPKNLE